MLFVISILLYAPVSGQYFIKGKILSNVDSSEVSTASVVISDYLSNSILGYTISDQKGKYKISIPQDTGILVITVRHLTFKEQNKKLVIVETPKEDIVVDFFLQEKSNLLDSVFVKPDPPILVKKDTIIYDIQHWAKASDLSLEEVLFKIKGIKILGNGEIEVEGKTVDKVLVDGEEIGNAGAAVLTKSIDPSMVESIEVRFKEENQKIKDNLLSQNDYVVLDIKLKGDIKKSAFGKGEASIGLQKVLHPGIYCNGFSIRRKIKMHFFGEYDAFDDHQISLKNIRNLGEEASNNVFKIPADFEGLKQKETFEEDIYGFSPFTRSAFGIVGFTTRYNLHPQWDVTIGSYNELKKRSYLKRMEQFFEEENLFSSSSITDQNVLSSKNKLSLEYDGNKDKMSFNTNFVYYDRKDGETQESNALRYLYDSQGNEPQFYTNFLYEKLWNKKIGFSLVSSYTDFRNKQQLIFDHNNDSLGLYIVGGSTTKTFEINQNQKSRSKLIIFQPELTINSMVGQWRVGGHLQDRRSSFLSRGFDSQTKEELDGFSQEETKYKFRTIKPYFGYSLPLSNILISAQIGYNYLNYFEGMENKENQVLDWNINSLIQFSNRIEFQVSYRNELSTYPLLKNRIANNFISSQVIESSGSQILPQKERSLSSNLSVELSANTTVDFALISGESLNSNNVSVLWDNFLLSTRDQLKNNYILSTIQLSSSVPNTNIDLVFEPSLFENWQNYRHKAEIYNVSTKRYFLGLQIKNNNKKSRINYLVHPIYSVYQYSDSQFEETSQQNMFRIKGVLDWEVKKNRLFINTTLKEISIFNNTRSDFLMLGLGASYFSEQFRYALQVYNMTNQDEFVIQVVDPNFFTRSNNSVFSRFIKFSVGYTFK